MAKFTSQEVSALQGGGNASAKEIYFKEWDPQRHSFPDSSNVERLRDFIKHVYVDRRYTGERSFDKPPRVKMWFQFLKRCICMSYRVKQRTPMKTEEIHIGLGLEAHHMRTHMNVVIAKDLVLVEEAMIGIIKILMTKEEVQDMIKKVGSMSWQYGDYRRSPARAEIVNDWRREDRFGSGKRSDDGRISDASSQLEGKSPNRQKDLDRTASSSSLASSNGNPAESKREDIGTLIDFDAVPEPPTIATVLPPQQTVAGQSVVQPTISSNADNWACFDSPTVVKVTEAPSNANLMGLVLSELSVPAYVPVQTAGIPGTGGFPTTVPSGNSFGAPPVGMSILSFGSNVPVAAPGNNLTMFPPVSAQGGAPVGHTIMSPFGVGAPAAATTKILTAFPSGGTPAAAPGLTTAFPSNGGQWPTMLPQQPSLFPATGFQHTAHTFTPPGSEPSSYQPRNFSIAPNTQGPPSIPSAQTSQAVSKQPSPPEVKPSGGKELPEDLFAPTYPSSAPYPGWQTGPPQGYGFNMQFNPAVSMQMFPHSSQSTNPFDVNSEVSSVHAPTFPSMASLQGALPNMSAPAGLLRTSSLGTPTPTWMPSQSNYPLAMPPQAPSFASAMLPGAYMGQQLPNNLPPRQQAVAGAFGPPNLNQQHQQLGGIYSAPATPNLYSAAGGNPFG
ncbi:NSP (nuclear shuttle protein)-interacting GTPase [Actinidia rufa]|uniref:NSP (Nuclear shuttle protein)-interacting GTPase n=1 Tax=Actinidia rufa TaxID=165716 RepID=A0A7J0FHV2_9ERIC|nr:NSP (nuclear shuttle protein)-interacting GTPase [Actinidia rufa]